LSKSRFYLLLTITLGLLLASGCATRPPAGKAAPESIWLAHRARLETLTDWQAQGRVAIRRGDDGWNASFDWRQRHDSYRLRLRGPFGQGGIELHGDRLGVWMRHQDKPPVFASNVEELLAQEIGWRLPVLGLVDWLRGLPVASQPAMFDWDQEGRLQTLQQDGWQIDYPRYRSVGELQLPDKVQLMRDELQVKLVIDTWLAP
jgi:outer membrane lipoprotein LolB